MTLNTLVFYSLILSSQLSLVLCALPQAKKPSTKTTKTPRAQAYTEINSLNEFQQAINSNKPTVLLFYAPWCKACDSMKPVFEAEAQRYKNQIQFIAIDATKEDLKDPVDMFGIQGIPTLYYKEVGLKTKDQFNATLTRLYGTSLRLSTPSGLASSDGQVGPHQAGTTPRKQPNASKIATSAKKTLRQPTKKRVTPKKQVKRSS